MLYSSYKRERKQLVVKNFLVKWTKYALKYDLKTIITGMINVQGLLIDCNQMSADYLFQPDKSYDVCYDTGDKVIQCGRHNDIFKFWLMWRAKVCID